MALLELDTIKINLGVALEENDEDAYLQGLRAAALRACELRTGRYVDQASRPAGSQAAPFSEADLAMVSQAALIMIAEWYLNREATAASGSASELPLAVTWLLDPLKDYTDR